MCTDALRTRRRLRSYNLAMVHSPVRPSPRSGAPSSPAFDICIRGGGIVGHTLALLLARDRLRIALYTPCLYTHLTLPTKA